MTEYKNGVVWGGRVYNNGEWLVTTLNKPIQDAIIICDDISVQETSKELFVTSLVEGKHSKRSLHPVGSAFDCRTWIYANTQKLELLKLWKEKLGRDYDILLEFEGEVNEHFHIEYDPK